MIHNKATEKARRALYECVNNVLSTLCRLKSPELMILERGWFFLFTSSGTPICEIPIGQVNRPLFAEFKTMCLTRVEQILQPTQLVVITKGKSRVKATAVRGAIKIGPFILSFCGGFKEDEEEAICLGVAVKKEWLTIEEANEMARQNRNHYWPKLWEALNGK